MVGEGQQFYRGGIHRPSSPTHQNQIKTEYNKANNKVIKQAQKDNINNTA